LRIGALIQEEAPVRGPIDRSFVLGRFEEQFLAGGAAGGLEVEVAL
jgi:hypothetical protein